MQHVALHRFCSDGAYWRGLAQESPEFGITKSISTLGKLSLVMAGMQRVAFSESRGYNSLDIATEGPKSP
jgi:hypothetical protein